MKISSFYYLAYPDCLPDDPLVATSEVYVEVASDGGSLTKFDYTYSLTVCTVGYLQLYLKQNSFYSSRSLIVVNKFDDKEIEAALEAVLQSIDAIAVRK